MRNRGRFYITRMKRATFSEFFYRSGLALRQLYVSWLVRQGRLPCIIPQISLSTVTSLVMPALRGTVDRGQVESILSGLRYMLNTEHEAIAAVEQQWRDVCSCVIDHSRSKVDIRAVWEPARLQHVTLLLARLQQQPDAPENGRIKEFARAEILRWLADNPFLYGPHYLSAMECGLRIPVFFNALLMLDNLSSSDVETILNGVFMHAWWIEKKLSLFSSLGNHTVCEAMGLVFAGSIFRETEAGARWLKTGITLLVQELPHQVLADGGPAEQAFGYHRFVLDIFWLAVDFLENNSLRRCDDFRERLLVGEEFLSSFSDSAGNIPAVGDYDDGYAIAPGLSPQRITPAGLHPKVNTFSTSGYTVVRGNGESLLTFDHGPLGMAPLYNHGHADALSVNLAIGGTPFLVDSGTYRYNGVPAFRRYFKSTRAHNTVTVDGMDQATQLTGFVWGEPFSGHLEQAVETECGLLIRASHDGYGRLIDPVRHIRSIQSDPDGAWVITDLFHGSGQHIFELNYHFHPEVSVTEQGSCWLVERNGHGIRVELAVGRFNLLRGEEEPPMGWYSSAYNLKAPSPVLQTVRNGASEEVRFETRITVV